MAEATVLDRLNPTDADHEDGLLHMVCACQEVAGGWLEIITTVCGLVGEGTYIPHTTTHLRCVVCDDITMACPRCGELRYDPEDLYGDEA